MTGRVVPDADHISRLCGGSHLDDEGKPTATAFMLRQDEDALSVNWLEHLQLADRQAEISEVQRVLAAKMNRVGATARIAVLNTGHSRSYVRDGTSDRREVSVLHEPEQHPGKWSDPSHCGMHNLPPYSDSASDIVAAELLVLSILETYPAR